MLIDLTEVAHVDKATAFRAADEMVGLGAVLALELADNPIGEEIHSRVRREVALIAVWARHPLLLFAGIVPHGLSGCSSQTQPESWQ